MCKKSIDACRTHDDFVGYGKKHGGRVEPGGRHTKVFGPKGGMAPVPHHPGEIAKGTRCSIIKMFIAIGLGFLAIIAIAI